MSHESELLLRKSLDAVDRHHPTGGSSGLWPPASLWR